MSLGFTPNGAENKKCIQRVAVLWAELALYNQGEQKSITENTRHLKKTLLFYILLHLINKV